MFKIILENFVFWSIAALRFVFGAHLCPYKLRSSACNAPCARHKILCFRAILLSLIFLTSLAIADNKTPSFQKVLSLKQLIPALSHAKKKSQFVLIDFNTKNCAACDDLKKHTFSDADVETALKNYHLIEITLTDHNKASFKKRFNVEKTPALVFLDKAGQFLPEFTTTGFVSPQQLLSLITRVNTGNEN